MRSTIEIFIIALLASQVAQAKHIVPVQPNETISTSIAEDTYNRLYIKGERIQSVRGLEGDYDLEKDEVNGEIYLKAKINNGAPISLFLTTEQANHYHVLLTPESRAEPIVQLVPELLANEVVKAIEESVYEDPAQGVIDFVLLALNEKNNEKLMSEAIVKPSEQHLHDTFVLTPLKTLNNNDYQGMLYKVTNRGDQTSPLRSDYFHTNNVIAVGLQHIVLKPKESTHVLVVTQRLTETDSIDDKDITS